VSRDRSLDEFLGGEQRDAEQRDDPDGDGADDDPDEPVGDAEGDDAVEPAVSTYAFSPDGAPCAACGAVVEKRWLDDGELVCPDCKAW
jgi:hypothetical protein